MLPEVVSGWHVTQPRWSRPLSLGRSIYFLLVLVPTLPLFRSSAHRKPFRLFG